MQQEVILIEDVEGLGRKGSVVRVRNGYAYNYLLPRRLAVLATTDNMRRLEKLREKYEKEEAERIERAKSLVDRLEGASVTIAAKASEEGSLYGSVQVPQIVEALADSGLEVEPRSVRLAEPIKHVGVYAVPVHLHETVKTEIKVFVVAEGESEGSEPEGEEKEDAGKPDEAETPSAGSA